MTGRIVSDVTPADTAGQARTRVRLLARTRHFIFPHSQLPPHSLITNPKLTRGETYSLTCSTPPRNIHY